MDVAELWRYRDLLLMLMWRDISVRYKQAVLGVAWAVLQPAMMMLVFAVVFGRLAKLPSGGLPYPLFVFAGLLPWTFFATAVTNAAHSVVENERLVTKVYFPRLAIPLAAIGAALVDFAIAFSVLVVLMICYGVSPGWSILALPLAVLLLCLAAVGVGLFLAALNVSYRDFRYLVGFLVQLWMFATPAIYMDYVATETNGSRDMVTQTPGDTVAQTHRSTEANGGTTLPVVAVSTRHPIALSPSHSLTIWDVARKMVSLNPLTFIVALFRAATLGQPIPWDGLVLSAMGSLLMLLTGLAYFRRVEDTFADII
jgi:lipopolysaccharide transport system permease protein